MPQKKKITPLQIGHIWQQAEKLGAFISVIEGGEAILHPEFFEILRQLHPFSNIVVLVSNSVTLDRSWIKNLKKNGLSVLHLSLNSSDQEKNDEIRGHKGHFQKVMANIEAAKEFGMPVYLSCVLHHNNKEDYLELIKLAEKMQVGISGALLVAMGRYSDQRSERLTEDDYRWLLKILDEYGHILRFDWNNNVSNCYECPAGFEKFAVSVYGDIMSCVCNHLSFGNALDEPLADIYKRMQTFSLFKERNPLCLASFDTVYLREYLDPIADSMVYPVSIFQHPKHPAYLENGKMIEAQL